MGLASVLPAAAAERLRCYGYLTYDFATGQTIDQRC
jgi:hypothetical protein